MLEMLGNGVSTKGIALKFGLARSRITSIGKACREEKAMKERRAKLQAEVRKADDLDRPWIAEDLFPRVAKGRSFW